MSKLEALKHRLDKIRDIIEDVDNRCMAVDGPVTPTEREITAAELKRIYKLAGGKNGVQI